MRAEALLRTLEDVGLRMRVAAYALHIRLAHGELCRVAMLLSETQALATQDAPPGEEAVFLFVGGMCRLQLGEIAEAESMLQRMERLADATGALFELVTAWHFGFRVALIAHDLPRARAYRARMQQLGDFLPPHTQHALMNTALLALAERDFDGALAAARAALDYGDLFPVFRPLWQTNHAQILLARGEMDGAGAVLDDAIADAHAARLPATECVALLLRAATDLQLGETVSAEARLRGGFAAARASVACRSSRHYCRRRSHN